MLSVAGTPFRVAAMLFIKVNKERTAYFLGCLMTGKPIEPTGPDG
jgi:hypothetical protein